MVAQNSLKRKSESLTWIDLVKLEPRLGRLEMCLLAWVKARRFNWRDWFRFKLAMTRLVGWCRDDNHPTLATSRAYEIAYARLFETFACSQKAE